MTPQTTLEERFGKCPYATAQSLISGKWAVLILMYLEDGPVRFNELLRKMPKMTHATLSVQLKDLEAYGLISRKQYDGIPAKVEYSLTEIGKKLWRPGETNTSRKCRENRKNERHCLQTAL